MNLPKMSNIKPFKNYSKFNANNAHNNILNRNFNITSPNLVWVSNITYVKVNGNFFYICVITPCSLEKSFLINVILQSFSNKNDLEPSLFRYIEGFYNSNHPYSFNYMTSPKQKENLFF